ncbi:MAG TPA: amino acid ABC transporter substrate-binding protein [Acidimicrobiia bacterium]|nr:amino acid ABC transporter substrate-binding protein [Acidimicrobiia bacterium]
MKAWRLAAVTLAAMALVVSACGDAADTTTTAGDGDVTTTAGEAGDTTVPAGDTTVPEGDTDPIVMATSLPLTGGFSIPAIKHQDGYQLCVDLINEQGGVLGRELVLEVEDNQSVPETAVTQYERFVDEADVLLGTFSSLITGPTSAIAEQNGMVYPVPSGGAQRIWERGFQNMFYFQQGPAEGIGRASTNAMAYYLEQGVMDALPATAAVVWADDPFASGIANGLLGGEVTDPDGNVVADLAPGFLAEAGIEVVMDDAWAEGFTDWLTFANSIAQSGAEAIFASTASVDEAVALVQALQTVGHQPSYMYMSQGAQSEFADLLAGAENHIAIHTAWHASLEIDAVLGGETFSNADFVAAFEGVHGRPPDEDEAIPFSVCQGMVQAIEGAGTTDNAAIADWLRSRTADDPVTTVLGEFHWDEKGLPIDRDYNLTQWQDGDLNFIFPVGEFPGTTDLVYPKAEW